ncbi:MAG TPA: LacI family DNA-binding transcriptional regulator [Devosiaceae bacterium]|jgi:DNA-binding LacI/PurR family transcriptional regulator|nr:LacI family DNA-binding transcriptional regulator [Devosiaceae bacterium]
MSRAPRPPARPRRVTALDVAQLAGVSRSAVSRTLTEGASVSPATREKVLLAAAELGYHRNALVRGMVRQRSGIIGVVTGRLDNPFIALGLEQLSHRLQQQGLKTLIYSGDAESDLKVALPSMVEYRVDGCFILSNDLSPKAAALYTRLDIPLLVMFNSDMEGISDHSDEVPVGVVDVDNVEISRQVADLLVALGCRRFAYVAGLPNAATSRERQRGFAEGLAAQGRALAAVETGHFSYEGGRDAARALLALDGRPDALYCGNDLMAMAAMDVARSEFGLEVPRDLAIVGFDDIQVAGYPAYDLTTVRQPVARIVETGVEMMLAFIEDPAVGLREVRLPSELIHRRSTMTTRSGASP